MFYQCATLFFLLCVSHALCDFAFQNDYITRQKRRILADGTHNDHWGWVLGAHALIHGGGVYFVTGHMLLPAVLETVCHAAIDFHKCEGRLTYNQDQTLHILCKAFWVFIAISSTT